MTFQIPPRWLHCPRKGDVIAEKFLPFKTPLDARYDEQVPDECRFDVEMFFMTVRRNKIRIGLWVDLTNTNRFYDEEAVKAHECRYVKLSCKGRDETPTAEQVTVFINLCEGFISRNPLDTIAVHCTHGFNRTGFLIIAYLIEKLDWSLDAALGYFARARPPGIYKQDYLTELHRRYGDPEDQSDVPRAPPRPDWCFDDNDQLDDEGFPLDSRKRKFDDRGPAARGHGGNENNKRQRREAVNKEFMDGLVPGVTNVTVIAKLNLVRDKVHRFCNWDESGFPGGQPVSLDQDNIQYLSQKPYKVSWKADGTRYMMLIDGPGEVYCIDRDDCVFHVPNLSFPHRKNPSLQLSETLVDGEMIIDEVNGQSVPRFLIYDIIKYEGQDVGGTDFDRRMLCINKEIIGPRYELMKTGQLDKSKESFSIRCKQFWDLHLSGKLLDGKFAQEISHGVDGLIFQPSSEGYHTGQCNDMLKWKPPSMNTVDFRLKVAVEKRPGMLQETKGYLYVGSYNVPFAEIKVTKELKELNGKIVECSYIPQESRWQFMRQRTDKSFPNSYTTAISVCKSISRPVTKEMLLDFIQRHAYRPSQQHAERSSAMQSSDSHMHHQRADNGFAIPHSVKVKR